jgi:uncharacterized damage-inducible protein DinB
MRPKRSIGLSSANGFDLDFEKLAKAAESVTSLAAAREWMERAYAAIQFLRSRSAEELPKPLPEGPILGGQPKSDIVWAMVEHTAHRRGALTVYSRELGEAASADC